MKQASPPLLSIICPIRDMEGRLQNLETWLVQISGEVEVILVYDDSLDQTYSEITQLISKILKHGQISIISGRFGAPGLARNAGLKVAKGAWICFWDSDDLGFPESIIRILERKEPEDSTELYCFGYDVVTVNGQIMQWTGWKKEDNLNFELLSMNPGLWRFCILRDIAISREFSSLRMGEDQLYLVQIELEKLAIKFEDKIAYRYFRNVQGQLTSSKDALLDLGRSLDLLLNEKKINPARRNFISLFLIRQTFTALKTPSFNLKVKALRVVALFLIQEPRIFVKHVVRIARSRNIE